MVDIMLQDLKFCFLEDFTLWLVNSNNPNIDLPLPKDKDVPLYLTREMENRLMEVETVSLTEIFEVLLLNPRADYFWYNYGGELTWSLPEDGVVPAYSLRVNRDKIKAFLRSCKIEEILK